MKKCVHCKEMIDEKATKCKFCQADLRNWFMRHKLITLVLGAIFLMGVFFNSVTTPPEQDTVTPVPQQVSAYEIISQGGVGDVMSIDVYTVEQNPTELTKINDKLVKGNPGYGRLFIRYFNDKVVAKDYFTKQMSETVTDAEKDELFKHYIADFKSTTGEFNINTIQGWETVKRY